MMLNNMIVDSAMIDEKSSCEAYKGEIVTEPIIIIIAISFYFALCISHSV